MRILCVGLSHHTAPLELRERLTYTATDLASALNRFALGVEPCLGGIRELAILSTCNRLELYAVSVEAAGQENLVALLRHQLEAAHQPALSLAGHLYHFENHAAARHLCRVAAGLDSQVLGESQILGQVAEAHDLALKHGAAGPVVSALFRAAIGAGKRARTETAISRHATSLSAVAVQAASRAVSDLPAACVLVIGAGEMAELAMKALHRHQVRNVTIANRTPGHARDLAGRWHAQSIDFDQLDTALAGADLVISATASAHVVLTTGQVQAAMQRRPERALVLIDLAVPRDIDPDAGRLPNVLCLNLDELDVDRLNGLDARRQAIPQVEAIVEAEAERFGQWLEGWAVSQVIAGLRAKADAIRQVEVERTLRRLPHLSTAERQHVEALAEALLNRLLHEPTLRLKAQAGGSQAAAYSATVSDLFGLDGTA